MASPASPPHKEEDAAGAAAVCCMCGDHGLPRELFRCKSCGFRLQHSYCSDLYPRATAYRRCNWCLSREHQQAGGAAGYAAAYYGTNKPAAPETKRKAAATTASDGERQQEHRREGCSSRRSPAELGYNPVKKIKRKADERAPADAGVKGSFCCNNAGESKELMRAGKAAPARVRVKVRRYKLLAEVISC